MNPKQPDPKKESWLRSTSLLLAIPSLLVISPLCGLFLGRFADRWLKTTPRLEYAGLALGFLAAIREIYLIIRRVKAEQESARRR